MNWKLTLNPSLGWVAGSILAALMAALALTLVIHKARAGAHDDAGWTDTIRRSTICLLLSLMALTPSTVTQATTRAVNATDVFIAVDVTGSMAVRDASYGDQTGLTRIDAARRAVKDLVTMYPDAGFAAVRFGASGTLDLPVTPDGRAVVNWADGLSVEPTGLSSGSNLDAPLNQLVVTLKETKDRRPDDRIILYVITDGEQTSPRARRSFSTLRAYLDDSFVMGVGSVQGGRVPVTEDRPGRTGTGQADGRTGDDWVKDPSTGQPGISKMDEGTMKEMADEMSGHYLALESGRTARSGQSGKTSSRYRVVAVNKVRRHLTPFVWPLGLAVLALLIWELAAWVTTSGRLL
ncbi:vWA domain-containing protein [Bifidobacterium favimelis]|uniref:VWA domain-containing protein n=1 Tax=Bifidobacterium favimelis TaxID=3122979 RepID=A0ABU8ZMF6_9BIFI